MLKMAVVQTKNNLYWYTFVDEFSHKSYNGRTFNTMAEAVDFANEHIVYNEHPFDLVEINQPKYIILDSYAMWENNRK